MVIKSRRPRYFRASVLVLDSSSILACSYSLEQQGESSLSAFLEICPLRSTYFMIASATVQGVLNGCFFNPLKTNFLSHVLRSGKICSKSLSTSDLVFSGKIARFQAVVQSTLTPNIGDVSNQTSRVEPSSLPYLNSLISKIRTLLESS